MATATVKVTVTFELTLNSENYPGNPQTSQELRAAEQTAANETFDNDMQAYVAEILNAEHVDKFTFNIYDAMPNYEELTADARR